MGTLRVRAPITLLWVMLACALTAPTAHAQTSIQVPLTLASQTPWTTPDERRTSLEESVLQIQVVATNNGAATLANLSIVGSLGPAFVSRQAFEDAIANGPSSVTSSRAIPIDGTLAPGTTRTFLLELDMASMDGVAQDDSKVYPVRVELRSAGRIVGSLFTNAIHLVREPEAPMLFAWWLELSWGPAFGPDGRLADPAIEAALAPGGALAAPAAALRSLTTTGTAPIDLVVRASLLEDVRTMAGGYQRADGSEVAAGEGAAAAAQAFLDLVRAAATAPSVQVIALPLDEPSIPAMLGSGLVVDLRRHEDRAATIVRQILGTDPSGEVVRPPAGLLDDATLTHYAVEGATTILGDADAVSRPTGPNGLAPAATATLTGSVDTPLDVILPDPGTEALMDRVDLLADPVRGAQAVLGELAVIWKEQPVPEPPDVRGIALALPRDLPPTIWPAMLTRVSTAPWLAPGHAQDLAAGVVPVGEPATLLSPATTTFSDGYAQRILALHRDVDAFASMLVDPGDTPDSLRRDLLRAESLSYLSVGESSGAAWLEPVAARTSAAFASTTPKVQQIFTFTSREGTIPLRMGDPGDDALRVQVVLQSSQFDFPDGSERDMVLERPNQVVEFAVVARASGQNPIAVTVRTPDGTEISSQTIVVRTTAVNSIALIITGGAGAVLLLLYARRRARRNR